MRRLALGCDTIPCARRLGLLILACAVVGCGPNQVKVSGRVLFDGKPLPGGRVTFRPADPAQNSVSAVIDEQGNYAAVLPPGDVQVCVDNTELEPRSSGPIGLPPGLTAQMSEQAKKALGGARPDTSQANTSTKAPAGASGRYVPIPARYYNVETSDLKFKAYKGEQNIDLELHP